MGVGLKRLMLVLLKTTGEIDVVGEDEIEIW